MREEEFLSRMHKVDYEFPFAKVGQLVRLKVWDKPIIWSLMCTSQGMDFSITL